MYTLAIFADFIAQHHLTVENAGPENELHSHHYRVEVMLECEELDSNGYVLDIDDLKVQLEGVIATYRDQTLNDLDSFSGLNPSLEHFTRIFCESLDEALYAPNLTAISVKLWEDDVAWIAYDLEREAAS